MIQFIPPMPRILRELDDAALHFLNALVQIAVKGLNSENCPDLWRMFLQIQEMFDFRAESRIKFGFHQLFEQHGRRGTVTQDPSACKNRSKYIKVLRNAVLSSYRYACCITGMADPELLIASHIKPWKDSDWKKERTNPRNGLCLNALHDKAFDRGLLTVLPDYTVRISSKLSGNDDGTMWIKQCDKQSIILPERFLPCKEFLEYHNDVVFQP